jgi:hypothetical protein
MNVFSHSKTAIFAGPLTVVGNQIDAPFSIPAAGSYMIAVDARLHGQDSAMQLEKAGQSDQPGHIGWSLADPSATFDNDSAGKPLKLNLAPGLYRFAVSSADVYSARIFRMDG